MRGDQTRPRRRHGGRWNRIVVAGNVDSEVEVDQTLILGRRQFVIDGAIADVQNEATPVHQEQRPMSARTLRQIGGRAQTLKLVRRQFEIRRSRNLPPRRNPTGGNQ